MKKYNGLETQKSLEPQLLSLGVPVVKVVLFFNYKYMSFQPKKKGKLDTNASWAPVDVVGRVEVMWVAGGDVVI